MNVIQVATVVTGARTGLDTNNDKMVGRDPSTSNPLITLVRDRTSGADRIAH
ncbi:MULTISPECIES: hypothetical protein [unclassified Caballeronia]|uniref:hypothetical protein n=1 Tax=unclassified Caballeronia TaxID=2646786 RepID=UPI00285A3D8C|nr:MULTISPECIES: hypothetical protein [unclassified Caballeronia]MDR5754478.1 hypothetical protein [Caballeronia sp. LZ024]MDR5840856.1 hypothetical protein [Caballeronia sp. LZ031]